MKHSKSDHEKFPHHGITKPYGDVLCIESRPCVLLGSVDCMASSGASCFCSHAAPFRLCLKSCDFRIEIAVIGREHWDTGHLGRVQRRAWARHALRGADGAVRRGVPHQNMFWRDLGVTRSRIHRKAACVCLERSGWPSSEGIPRLALAGVLFADWRWISYPFCFCLPLRHLAFLFVCF